MLNLLRTRIDTFKAAARNVHYVQGQSPKPNIREYFYYIDHHGQVNFLRDVCKAMIKPQASVYFVLRSRRTAITHEG